MIPLEAFVAVYLAVGLALAWIAAPKVVAGDLERARREWLLVYLAGLAAILLWLPVVLFSGGCKR